MLEATCRLVESPPARVLLVIGYPDIYECADHVPEVLEHKPIGLEGIDNLLVEYTRRKGINSEGLALLPGGGGWLLAEFGANTVPEAESQARGLMAALGRSMNPPQMALFTNRQQIKWVWDVRESSLGVISYVPGEPLSWEGWEDSAVAPEKLGKYLARSSQADGRLRISRHALRTFRRRLRPQPHEFRSAIHCGRRQISQVHGRRR